MRTDAVPRGEAPDPRIALVCGATAAQGREVARALGEEGWDLRLADRDAAALRELGQTLRDEFEIRTAVHPTDLTQIVNVEALALEIDDVELVVVALGVVPPGGVFEVVAADWHAGWETAVRAAMDVAREMAESLEEVEGGRVVVLLSPEGEGDDYAAAANAAVRVFVERLDAVLGVDVEVMEAQAALAAFATAKA